MKNSISNGTRAGIATPIFRVMATGLFSDIILFEGNFDQVNMYIDSIKNGVLKDELQHLNNGYYEITLANF